MSRIRADIGEASNMVRRMRYRKIYYFILFGLKNIERGIVVIMKILIHESDQDIRKLYQVIFAPSNFELTFSETVYDTRIKANRHQYDLVMMDIEYPSMEGLSEARKMVSERPNQPLLLISSIPLEQEELTNSPYRTRSAIMMKPFNIKELRGLIHHLTESHSTLENLNHDYLTPASIN